MSTPPKSPSSSQEQPRALAHEPRLIHELNQRYRREWDRAERLQAELDAIRGSRAWRLLALWHTLKAFWRRPKTAPVTWSFRSEPIPAAWPPASGAVSIVIPFKDRVVLLRNCLRGLRY